MAAADTLTFDIIPPRRPGVPDVDPTLINDAAYPPVAGDPYADQLNQWGLLCQRFGAIVPIALFSVRFAAGVPVLDSFTCLPTALITSSFTITDNGTGDTTITWPAGAFPTPLVKPMATVAADVIAFAPVALSVTNGVRVKTYNASSTLTDIAFTVAVY